MTGKQPWARMYVQWCWWLAEAPWVRGGKPAQSPPGTGKLRHVQPVCSSTRPATERAGESTDSPDAEISSFSSWSSLLVEAQMLLKVNSLIGDFTASHARGRLILWEKGGRWSILVEICLSLNSQIEMRLQEGFLCFTAVSEYRNSQIAANKSKTHADAWTDFIALLSWFPKTSTTSRSALGVGGFYHLMLDNVDGVGVCSFIWSHRAPCALMMLCWTLAICLSIWTIVCLSSHPFASGEEPQCEGWRTLYI